MHLNCTKLNYLDIFRDENNMTDHTSVPYQSKITIFDLCDVIGNEVPGADFKEQQCKQSTASKRCVRYWLVLC